MSQNVVLDRKTIIMQRGQAVSWWRTTKYSNANCFYCSATTLLLLAGLAAHFTFIPTNQLQTTGMEKRRVYVMSPCRQCCKDYGQTLEGGGRAQKPSHVAKLNCTAL